MRIVCKQCGAVHEVDFKISRCMNDRCRASLADKDEPKTSADDILAFLDSLESKQQVGVAVA